MESTTYWIAIDSAQHVSMHQYEPFYNHLFDKWKSSNIVYVSRGMIDILVDNELSNNSLLKAYAYEIDNSKINSKARVLTVKKIFKDRE